MSEFPKFESKRENEQGIERESKPSKIVLLVRHPSVKWFEQLLEKAELEGKDIETYAPIDKEGLKITGLLSEYLQNELPQTLGDTDLNRNYSIYTSPIKRAKHMADILSKNIKLSHTEDPEIPIPANNEPIELDSFSEVSFISKKQEALDLVKEAEQKGVHPVKFWFEKNQDEVITKLNEKLPDVEEGLRSLEDSKTPLNILFSHRITLALTLWLIEQKKLGRKDLAITREDLPEIIKLTGKMAYTSISEIRLQEKEGEKKWFVQSIAETPHL